MTRLFAVSVLFLGCSHGFDRGRIRERLAGGERQVTDADVRAALDLRPQLSFPIRVGAAFLDEETVDRADPGAAAFRWRETDRDALIAAGEPLRAQGVVSDFFVISPDVIAGKDLKHLRLAAARHGADAVLVVKGAAQIDRYSNPLAVLYLSIVGGFFVPATHRDA